MTVQRLPKPRLMARLKRAMKANSAATQTNTSTNGRATNSSGT